MTFIAHAFERYNGESYRDCHYLNGKNRGRNETTAKATPTGPQLRPETRASVLGGSSAEGTRSAILPLEPDAARRVEVGRGGS